MANGKLGNPAVVGLAGFGGTTLLLQFHNLGWMATTPVFWVGLMFGGLMQLIAGYQEQKTGNNFGYCAFCSYGAFWISLVLLLMGATTFKFTAIDVAYFMVMWTIYTFIMWIGSLKTNGMLAFTFLTLLLGFIFLDLHFFAEASKAASAAMWVKVAGWDLIICALSAWYIMAHNIFADLWGRDVLPVGKAWLK